MGPKARDLLKGICLYVALSALVEASPSWMKQLFQNLGIFILNRLDVSYSWDFLGMKSLSFDFRLPFLHRCERDALGTLSASADPAMTAHIQK